MMEQAAMDARLAAAAASAQIPMDDVKPVGDNKKRGLHEDADIVQQSMRTAPVPTQSTAAASAAAPTVATAAVCQLDPILYGVQL